MPKTPSLPMEEMLILDKCASIESRCADLYRHFAGLHPEHPELGKLWLKTALEEDNHALQFRMLSRMKGEGISGLTTDVAKVNEVLEKLEGLFEQVRSARLSAADALRVGIKLENFLSEFHSTSVVITGDREMAHLLNAMMSIDLDHVARLEKALDKLLSDRQQ